MSIDAGRSDSLNLRQVTTEVANDIGAFEIRWQSFERASPLAFWTAARFDDDVLAKFAKNLLSGRHTKLL